MTERQLEEFIDKISVRGSILGLDSIRRLLDKMGNPQDQLKYVHIAGTNGKGSVNAFVSSILVKAHFRVGRYISPCVLDYREKIQVNGHMITQKALLEGMGYIKELCDEIVAEGNDCPTIFEVETALSFWYFDREKCDIVVLETGMGGRDDATNVVSNTLVAVITSISMDHMAFLGSDEASISRVKAGIIKKDCITVSAPQKDSVRMVLEERCRETESLYVQAGMPLSTKHGRLTQSMSYGEYKNVTLGLLGDFQYINGCVAIEVIKALRSKGMNISDKNIYDGMADTKWYGRFSVLLKKPLMVVDGAHNEAAATELMKSIDMFMADRPLIYVLGVFRDKEYEKLIDITCKRAAHVITVETPGNIRALPAIELAEAVRKVNPSVTAASSVEEGVEMARLLAGDKCGILIFGSLSYLGRVKAYIDRLTRT